MNLNAREICSFCHVGHVTEQNLTYTEWYEEELIVVPGVPARLCDYCGEKEFDPFVVGTLRRLLWSSPDANETLEKWTRIRRHRFDLEMLHSKDQFPPGE
jgi:YgiT-type zinc finger domain-containing protein